MLYLYIYVWQQNNYHVYDMHMSNNNIQHDTFALFINLIRLTLLRRQLQL